MEKTFILPKAGASEARSEGLASVELQQRLAHPGSLRFGRGLKVGPVLGKLQILDLQDCKNTVGLWIKALCLSLNSNTTEDNTPVPP